MPNNAKLKANHSYRCSVLPIKIYDYNHNYNGKTLAQSTSYFAKGTKVDLIRGLDNYRFNPLKARFWPAKWLNLPRANHQLRPLVIAARGWAV